MGLESLLALAIQGIGTAGAMGAQAIGLGSAAAGAGAGGIAGGIASATTGLAQGLAGTGAVGAGSAAAGGAGGLTGIGVTGSQVAAGLGTVGSIASAPKKPKDLNKPITNIKTNVGNDVAPKKKRKSVASTVQGGGLKRNSLG